MSNQVFISYSRKDKKFIDKLAKNLEEASVNVWRDTSNVAGGEKWVNSIETAIEESEYYLVVLSPDSIGSEWVEKEYTYAIGLGRKIIPLLSKNCEIPMALANIQYIDFRGDKYEESLKRLLQVLKAKIPTPLPEKKIPLRVWQMIGVIIVVIVGIVIFGRGFRGNPKDSTLVLTTAISTITPTLTTNSPTLEPPIITPTLLSVAEALSFQDDVTTATPNYTEYCCHDETESTPVIRGTSTPTSGVITKDRRWAPSPPRLGIENYYASGPNKRYYDAIQIKFNIDNKYDNNGYKMCFRAFVQLGNYQQWCHYAILAGQVNELNRYNFTTSIPPTSISDEKETKINKIKFDFGKVGNCSNLTSLNTDTVLPVWIEEDISELWKDIVSKDGWLTLMLWNARVDVVELELRHATCPVH